MSYQLYQGPALALPQIWGSIQKCILGGMNFDLFYYIFVFSIVWGCEWVW